MILGIQMLGVLFALFMIYLTYLHSKRKEFTMKEWSVWSLMWIIFIFIALYPNALDFVVKGLFALKRPLDFYIISGFMFLTGMIFHIYTIVRNNQKKIESIVRKTAMEK